MCFIRHFALFFTIARYSLLFLIFFLLLGLFRIVVDRGTERGIGSNQRCVGDHATLVLYQSLLLALPNGLAELRTVPQDGHSLLPVAATSHQPSFWPRLSAQSSLLIHIHKLIGVENGQVEIHHGVSQATGDGRRGPWNGYLAV